MPLKSIRTQHLQSHEDVFVELPETGVVVFTGSNSNGKSVIGKVLNALISGEITKPKVRRTLVTKGHSHGVFTCVRYDGVVLTCHIDHEASGTYVTLDQPGADTLTRFLSDKSMSELVRMFGFHYNKEFDVSLNIHNDDDRFLFVDTKHAANYACMNNTFGDEYVESALEQLRLTDVEIRKNITAAKQTVLQNQTLLDALTTIDVDVAQERRKKMLYIAINLQHMTMPPCPTIKGVPDVVTVARIDECPTVKYPTIINLPTNFPDISVEGSDLNDVLKGVCPACKRAFFS